MDDPHARYLISAKAVIAAGNKILLVSNTRKEWDLPGGKLQAGESIESALRRELREELNVDLRHSALIDAMVHHFYPDILVLIHACQVEGMDSIRLSDEHSAMAFFGLDELPKHAMAPHYLPAIESCIRADGTRH